MARRRNLLCSGRQHLRAATQAGSAQSPRVANWQGLALNFGGTESGPGSRAGLFEDFNEFGFPLPP